MVIIDSNGNIEINRGDMLTLTIKSKNKHSGELYSFQIGDVVRFKVMERKNCSNIVLQKDVKVSEVGESVQLTIPSEEMKIGEVINKPVDYWYEVELNPDSPSSVTIIGYTKENGPKILTLTPEGGVKK